MTIMDSNLSTIAPATLLKSLKDCFSSLWVIVMKAQFLKNVQGQIVHLSLGGSKYNEELDQQNLFLSPISFIFAFVSLG